MKRSKSKRCEFGNIAEIVHQLRLQMKRRPGRGFRGCDELCLNELARMGLHWVALEFPSKTKGEKDREALLACAEMILALLCRTSIYDEQSLRRLFMRIVYPSALICWRSAGAAEGRHTDHEGQNDMFELMMFGGATFELKSTERDVMRLISAGKTEKEAAEDLGISRETVKARMRSVRKKTGAKTSTEAVAKLHGANAEMDRRSLKNFRSFCERFFEAPARAKYPKG